MENTALRHVPVGTVFQLNGAPSHFPRRVHAFLDREFPDRWIGKGDLAPYPPDFTSLDFFFWGVCKRHHLS
jgi:hypothetical protein